MARLVHNGPEAEKNFNDHDVLKRGYSRLADEMKVDNYTNGTMSARQGVEAQTVDEVVRRKR